MEVAVWYKGSPLTVSGISRYTTCDDAVRALLLSEGIPESQLDKYVIAERWQGMERNLSPTTRLLRIWKTWGGAADRDVRFVLKKSDARQPKTHHQHGEQNGSIQNLLQKVLTQGELIKAQLEQLKDQQEEIIKKNYRKHRRKRTNSEASSVIGESALNQRIEDVKLLEGIARLNKQLLKEEKKLVKLSELVPVESSRLHDSDSEISELNQRLKRVERDCHKTAAASCQIEQQLKELDVQLQQRQSIYSDLEENLNVTEHEHNMLLLELQLLTHDLSGNSSVESYKYVGSESKMEGSDSNSDTGLSSLHSSADEERGYILDTLV